MIDYDDKRLDAETGDIPGYKDLIKFKIRILKMISG